MTHISKIPIPKDVHERILTTFVEGVTSPGLTERRGILKTLLTRTERIMLAKRLAIIVMLTNGDRYDEIALMLHVSKSTILRLHKQLDAGYFRPISRSFKREVGWKSFLDTLELLLSAGMPSIAGSRADARLKNIRARRKLQH